MYHIMPLVDASLCFAKLTTFVHISILTKNNILYFLGLQDISNDLDSVTFYFGKDVTIGCISVCRVNREDPPLTQ